MNSLHPRTLLALAIFGALVTPPQVHAQALNGSVVGNVKDASDAAVPGAVVALVSTTTGQSRQTTTDGAGAYAFATVQPGTYTVKVTMAGFIPLEETNVTVSANGTSRVDVTLKIGGATETVEVQGREVGLQTDSGEVRRNLTANELEMLPVPPGRNYENLFTMLPGFSPPSNAHSIPTNPSRSLRFYVNGGDSMQNNTRIDGAMTKNLDNADAEAIMPTLESIESVNVSTNAMDAETGFTGGGNVAVQTKSGTNQLHGSAFETYSGNQLETRSFFLPSNQELGKLVYHQFGGAAGGRIIKDKLFYFVSYEGIRDHEFAQVLQTVPDALVKSGNFSESGTAMYDPATGVASGTGRTPFPNNMIPAARFDPITLKLANMLPLPNVPGNPLTNNYDATGAYIFDREHLDTKVNWNPTAKLSSFVRLGYLNYYLDDPAVFGAAGGINVNAAGGDPGIGTGETTSLTAGATYLITPHLIMDGYFGFEHDHTQTEPPGTGQNLGLALGIPGTNGPLRYESGLPSFVFGTGYSPFGVANTAGNGVPYYRWDTSKQEVLNFDWIHGGHDVRFGTEIQQQHLDNLQPLIFGQGQFNFGTGPTQLNGGPSGNQFNSYATFVLGLSTLDTQAVVLPNKENQAHVPTNQNWYSAYIRDRWNVSRNLTISVGLRWDYYGFPNAGEMGIGVYNVAANNVEICGSAPIPSTCGVNMPKALFSPRLGVAYRISSSFVVRAGYGISQVPYSLGAETNVNYPIMTQPSYPAPNSFSWYGTLAQGIPPTVLPVFANGITSAPANVDQYVFPKNFPWPYSQSWNLTLQKELKFGFTAQAGYVANREVRAEGNDAGYEQNLNAGQIPGAGVAGQPYYASEGRTGGVWLYTTRGTTAYNSLQASLTRRFSRGVMFGANYTWSKFEVPYYPTDALLYQYVASRPVSSIDRTQVLSLNGVWELPFGKGKGWLSGSRIGSAILGGWSLNSLAVFYSGLPFSVTASGSSLNMPGATQMAEQVKTDVAVSGNIGGAYFDPLAFKPVTTPSFGDSAVRNMRGPGLVNVDAGLNRNFKVKERTTIQFRIDAFNALNTPHFSNPGGNVSNLMLNGDGSVKNLAGFSQVTSVTNNGRDGIDQRQFRLMLRVSF